MRLPWRSDLSAQEATPQRFANRREAGRRLAELLQPYAGEPGLIVLGLPRGGVPVAYEVARALDAPLDVFIVRKLGVPGHEEYAMGAIASGGIRVLHEEAVRELQIPAAVIDRVEQTERVELERRERRYRGARPPLDLEDRTVVLVDDGLATGATMLAAVAAVRTRHPRRLIVAVPVASVEACMAVRRQADACVCLATPEPFVGVGLWYLEFGQTTDEEVEELLAARTDADRPVAHH